MGDKKYDAYVYLFFKYYKILQRYASFFLADKSYADRIVMIITEEVYEDGLFFEGLHLRKLLMEKTRQYCLHVNFITMQFKNFHAPLPICSQLTLHND
jgi:hypothetical protein